jgi:hypothetical protein
MIPETVNTPAHQDDMLIRLSVELLEGFQRLHLILRIPTLNNFKINKKKSCVCVHCLGIVSFLMTKPATVNQVTSKENLQPELRLSSAVINGLPTLATVVTTYCTAKQI